MSTFRDVYCEPDELDRGVRASPETMAARDALRSELRRLALATPQTGSPPASTRDRALAQCRALHRTATVLFALWRERREGPDRLACACEFNEVTAQARALDKSFGIFDKAHLERFEERVREELGREDARPGSTEPTRWAAILRDCASQHSHGRAWPWVVLPSVAGQPYGRILLRTVATPRPGNKVFLVQPFFPARRSTLRHSHGINWAFARPLGEHDNTHVNIQWQLLEPGDCETRRYQVTSYAACQIVAVPPRTIHSIVRRRWPGGEVTPVAEHLRKGDCKTLEEQNRFGTLACLHVYKPSWWAVEKLAQSSFLDSDREFFSRYDMIVFDHKKKMAWAGGGGAWSQRMLQLGPKGRCCGDCFIERDPRAENLDMAAVERWLLSQPMDASLFKDTELDETLVLA